MHADVIREALRRQSFLPFTLRLTDGRTLSVPHPDYVAVSRRQVIVVNAQDESVTWLEPLLIVSVDYTGSGPALPTPGGANGGPPPAGTTPDAVE